MTADADPTTTSSRDLAPADRHPAPDVVRALALLGVIVMNYHGYLILRGASRRDGWWSELFDPWTGVLSTRFAATFVLVAGVGVTLMTRSATVNRGTTDGSDRVRTLRWRLASRGLVLYGAGLVLDMIWPGAILPFYGAMFAVAALLFTLRSVWIAAVGLAATLAAWAIAAWTVQRTIEGHSTRWLTTPPPRSPRGLVLDVAVNGTHPLLPWLAFFCAGMLIGRALGHPHLTRWLVGIGVASVALAHLGRRLWWDADDARARVLFSTDPFDRGALYVLSALGTAMVAFAAVGYVAQRTRGRQVTEGLRLAGQASLTIYVAHALAFNLMVDWLGWWSDGGVGTAVVVAVAVWSACSLAAVWWLRHHERAPLEQVYRSITR